MAAVRPRGRRVRAARGRRLRRRARLRALGDQAAAGPRARRADLGSARAERRGVLRRLLPFAAGLRDGDRNDDRRDRAGLRVRRGRAGPRAPRHGADARRLHPPRPPAHGLPARHVATGAAGRSCARDPRDRPGHDRHDLPRLRRATGRSRAAPTASSRSTSRSRAGWSTTPPRSGRSRAVSHEALDDAGIDGRASSTGSGSPTSARRSSRWDRDSGEPLHRALVWQDRRTAARCDELRDAGTSARPRAHRAWCSTPTSRARRSSGCSKRRRGRRAPCFGTIDSWLVFKLTGRHVTDYSNASRTLLFDIRKLGWDAELCELLGVDPASRCPSRVPLAAVYGDDDRVRRRGARRRDRRRPAGGALRPGVPLARAWRRTPTAPGSFVLLNTGHRGAGAAATGC